MKFHALAIGLGLLFEFGPVLLIAAGFGFRKLDRRFQVYFGGFAALYLVVHLFWWWYKNRFLLPLSPPLFILTALGVDRILELAPTKLRLNLSAARPLLFLLIALPLLARTGVFIYQAATELPDPYNSAALYIKEISRNPNEALIGANFFLLSSYSGHPAYTWEAIGEDEDPHRFMIRAYRDYQVRYLVWGNLGSTDVKRFGFLKDGASIQATVSTTEGDYAVNYLYLKSLESGDKLVHVYSLSVHKIQF